MKSTVSAILKGMEACLEKMEAMDLEANLEEMESESEHQEVPNEEAAVETVGTLEDRHLAVGRHRKPKKRNQGDSGSRKKLAAAYRRMTRCAVPAQCKGHGHQGPGQDNVVQGTPQGWTLVKGRWANLKGNKGIRDRSARQQLRLRKERSTSKGIRGRSRRQEPHLGRKAREQSHELEVAKQIFGTFIRLRKMSVRTLWTGRSPLKQKKRLHTE
jgi:hypothetical protein